MDKKSLVALILILSIILVSGFSSCDQKTNSCFDAPTYLVTKGNVQVLSMQDCPGYLISTAMPSGAKPVEHPFLKAQALDPSEEDALKNILDRSNNFTEFISLLNQRGYNVETLIKK